jgi:hypothetical protein
MSRNADALPGRTAALVPKGRAVFGDALTPYAAQVVFQPGVPPPRHVKIANG